MLGRKGGDTMTEYTTLFNAITDAISALEWLKQALILAQQTAEEIYMGD
jgi:hypothetical protein